LSYRCCVAASGSGYPQPPGSRSSARWRLDWWSRRESNSRPVVADHVSYRLTTAPGTPRACRGEKKKCEDVATKAFFPCSTAELQIRKKWIRSDSNRRPRRYERCNSDLRLAKRRLVLRKSGTRIWRPRRFIALSVELQARNGWTRRESNPRLSIGSRCNPDLRLVR
jgi:hypothetical protein